MKRNRQETPPDGFENEIAGPLKAINGASDVPGSLRNAIENELGQSKTSRFNFERKLYEVIRFEYTVSHAGRFHTERRTEELSGIFSNTITSKQFISLSIFHSFMQVCVDRLLSLNLCCPFREAKREQKIPLALFSLSLSLSFVS